MEFSQEVIDADVRADFGVAFERNAGFFHELDTAGDDPFLKFEVGDAIAQETAGLIVAFEYRYGVSGRVELVGSREAGGARAYNGYLLTRPQRRMVGLDE